MEDFVLARNVVGCRQILERWEQGAKGAFPDEDKHKPLLHFAVEKNEPELVYLLLKFGADPKVKYHVFTPPEVAAFHGHDDVLRLFYSSLEQLPPDLYKLRACAFLRKRKVSYVRLLLFGDQQEQQPSEVELVMFYLDTMWSYMKKDIEWSIHTWYRAVWDVRYLLNPSHLMEYIVRFFASTVHYYPLYYIVQKMAYTMNINQFCCLIKYINNAFIDVSEGDIRDRWFLTQIVACVILNVLKNLPETSLFALADVVRWFPGKEELLVDHFLTTCPSSVYASAFLTNMCAVELNYEPRSVEFYLKTASSGRASSTSHIPVLANSIWSLPHPLVQLRSEDLVQLGSEDEPPKELPVGEGDSIWSLRHTLEQLAIKEDELLKEPPVAINPRNYRKINRRTHPKALQMRRAQ